MLILTIYQHNSNQTRNYTKCDCQVYTLLNTILCVNATGENYFKFLSDKI